MARPPNFKPSRNRFTISLGSKLVGVILLAVIIGFSLLTLATIRSVKIGSETYGVIVEGKDFVADFLPPPLYPVDSFADAHIIEGNLQLYAEISPRILANKKLYQSRLEHWQQWFANSEIIDSQEWEAINKQFEELGDKFWGEMENHFLPAAKLGDSRETGNSVDRMASTLSEFRLLLGSLDENIRPDLSNAEQKNIEHASSRQVLLASTAVAIALIVLLFIYLVHLRVVKPLVKIEQSMQKLADGELATEVPYLSRTDEMGQMAQSLNLFKAIAVEEEQHKQELEQVIQVVGASLQALARGDLTHRINEPFPEIADRLRTSFNIASNELSSVIATVKSGADGMKSGTEEIAQASDDLSRRTETQAANLEETAAAVAEIVSTVKKTASGAGLARKVVSITKDEADKSGEVVRKAVDAMQGIEKTSAKINQIIGVIDEIAFQTSLLALNAGVEAARAGDAGRGFAVVAAEVRALAQRSADAAKEIKELLTASRTQVEQGVRLVGDTGESLRSIIERVAEINAVVADIATGAEEQSSSLQEVNAAVDQMDQVTQQNAAMVEQATAATRTLTQQSAKLAEIVSKFNTVATKVSVKSRAPTMRKYETAPRAPQTAPRKLAATGTDHNVGWEEF